MPNTTDYLNELINQKKKLAQNITAKGVTASENEKFNPLVDKVAQIEELRGEERTLDNIVDITDGSSISKVINYPDTVPSESVDIGVKVSSKNILDSTLWSTASSNKGLTIQYLPDEDCFVANGTITPTSSETSADIGIKSVNIPINNDKKYTLSAKYISGESEMSNLMFTCRDTLGSSGKQVISISPLLDKQNHTTTSVINATAIKDVRFYFYMGSTTPKTVTNYKFRIQLEESDTATTYTPYVPDLTATKVIRYGKNLFDMSLTLSTDYFDTGGGKLTVEEILENGYIVQGNKGASGKGDSVWTNGWFAPCAGNGQRNKVGCYVPAGVTITWSYDVTLLEKPHYPDDDYPYTFRTYNASYSSNSVQKPIKEYINLQLGVKKHIVVTDVNPRAGILCPQFTLNSNKLKIENIQLEIGNTDTNYNSFIKTEYTPAADGTVTGIKNLTPVTTLVTDGSIVISEVLKHISAKNHTTVLPSTGKNGITKVNQPIVDSNVDDNIAPENIKSGVQILGVDGTYEGTTDADYLYDETSQTVTIIG